MRLVFQEEDLSCRYFLCDTLISIMRKYTKLLINDSSANDNLLTHFSQIFDFGNEIIQTPNLLSTGLYMWKNIFLFFQEFNLIPSDEEENSEDKNIVLDLLFMLLGIFPASVTSENEEDRLQSLQLIEILHNFLINIETLTESQSNDVETVFESLQQEFDTIIDSDMIELSYCCSTICTIIEKPLFFTDDSNITTLFEFAVTFLENTAIPVEKRLILHTILESSVDLIANNDSYCSEIHHLIDISISMSIEICQQDRTDTNYEFPFYFFYLLSDSLNDYETTFELFFSLAADLAANDTEDSILEYKEVSLFAIKSIIESLQEVVSTRIEDVIHFIIENGDMDDEYVLNSACQTIDELFEYIPSAASKFIDEIADFLCKYATFSISIQTLDSVFYRSDLPPSNVEEIFKGLTEMISIESSNEQIEALLSCITSLFSRLTTTEEEILASFLPFINTIIASSTHSSLHSSVLDFFGRIVPIAPLTIKNELENLIPFAIETFSMSKIEPIVSSSFCLRSIVKVLPVSFTPYLPQVLPPLISILERGGENEEREQDEEIDDSILREVVLTLSTFVGYIPNEMTEFAQNPILDFITNEIGGLNRFLVHACESLAYAAEGYKILGIPMYEVINQIVPLLFDKMIVKDYVFSILMLSSEIVAVFGDQMADDVIDLIISSLLNILDSPPSSFLLTESSTSSIDPQIQTPLFFLFSQSIDMFVEGRFEGYFGRICDILISYLNNDNKSAILRCNAIVTAAHFCFSCKNLTAGAGTFLQMVQNASIHEMMSSQNIEANILIAKAIKYLVLAEKDQIQSRLEMIIQFSLDVIENCEYFGLFCAILMNYVGIVDINDHIDKIEKFFGNWSLLPNSDEIVFYSEFVVFVMNQNLKLEILDSKLPEIASALFASSDKHFESASSEIKTIFFSVLEKLSEDDLLELSKANESNMIRIDEHMKLFDD